jgi:hypothetical protein
LTTVSEVTDFAETSEVSGPGPHLAQVDPPHPFRSALKTLIIAAVVVSIAIGLYVYLGQKPPVASGSILTMNLYPVHTLVNSGGGADGMQGSGEYYDQLLILTKIKITNQTDIPLFLQDVSSTIKLPDGSEQTNTTASDKDMDRVFQAYPSLAYLRSDSIHRDITLSPGQSVQGLAVFNYPITQEQWNTLQSAKVVVSFMHQKNLEMMLPRQ